MPAGYACVLAKVAVSNSDLSFFFLQYLYPLAICTYLNISKHDSCALLNYMSGRLRTHILQKCPERKLLFPNTAEKIIMCFHNILLQNSLSDFD